MTTCLDLLSPPIPSQTCKGSTPHDSCKRESDGRSAEALEAPQGGDEPVQVGVAGLDVMTSTNDRHQGNRSHG